MERKATTKSGMAAAAGGRWQWQPGSDYNSGRGRMTAVVAEGRLQRWEKHSSFLQAAEDAFLDLIQADAGRLVRLRHPGVVHVVQALDESKNTMAMVTEPLFALAANVLVDVENIPKVPKELKGMDLMMFIWMVNYSCDEELFMRGD